MNNFHLEVFAAAIYDTKGLFRLVDQLRSITKLLYHNQPGFISQKVAGQVNSSLIRVFEAIESQNLEPQGDSQQKQFLEEIISYLEQIPQVKLTLAFEPDDNFTAKLGEVVSTLAGKKVLLDITVNHHIVGGIIIEYQGRYKDYSVEPRVNAYLKESLANMNSQGVKK